MSDDDNNSNSNKMSWYAMAFIVFSTVWGFKNIINGFVYFNGIQVIFSWILLFALYFAPCVFMVGELGSAFKNFKGGVSSWAGQTLGKRFVYYAGWTFWATQVCYVATNASGGMKALGWAIFRNAEDYDSLPSFYVQLATLAVFLLFCFISTKGVRCVEKISTIAGTSMFIMCVLFIVAMFSAPLINPNAHFLQQDFSLQNLIPNIDFKYITSLSILVFALEGVGGTSPYINMLHNPKKSFPKAVIAMLIMVVACAILGSIALGMIFDPNEINADQSSYVANAQYWAFQKLGNYYHMGDSLLVIYALCSMIAQFSTMLIYIDAPLRLILSDKDAEEYIPSKLLKQNKHGSYTNALWLVIAVVGFIICFGMFSENAANIVEKMIKLSSVSTPLCDLWIFISFISFRLHRDRYPEGYSFTKNNIVAISFAVICTTITLLACGFGMYSPDVPFMILSICMPIILLVLGMIMPLLARHERKRKLQK